MISIDRKKLESLLSISNCDKWTQPINNLLLSTKDDVIPVDQSYVDQVNTHGTWLQMHNVLKCDVQGLDITFPQEAFDFVHELFVSCTNKNNVWYNSENEWCFELYRTDKTDYFVFSYYNIYKILVDKYECNNLQVSKLITSMLDNVVELNGLTPNGTRVLCPSWLDNVVELNGLTPKRNT
jgi:hypothetical protein